MQNTVLMPEIHSPGGNDEGNIATRLTWEEQVVLEDNVNKVSSAAKHPKARDFV